MRVAGGGVMKRTILLVVAVMLCVCVCAHAADKAGVDICCYWIGKSADVNGRIVFQTIPDEGTIPLFDIGQGYLLDRGMNKNIYYTVQNDKGNWEIFELYSRKLSATLSDPDIIRVLAYYDDTVFYVKQVDGIPAIVAVDKYGKMEHYLSGKYNGEFAVPEVTFDFWEIDVGESEQVVINYSTIISNDGKVAYCVQEGTAWSEAGITEIIYYSTRDEVDIYVDKGSHPVWLDNNTLLYVGDDSLLYRYSINTGIISPYLSVDNREIVVPWLAPGERAIAVAEGYVGYVQMQWEGYRVVLVSLKTGEIISIKGLVPLNFMDSIVMITVNEE